MPSSAPLTERNTRRPETGSLRDRMTMSTRFTPSALKPRSFFTRRYATPGFAGCSSRASWSCMYARSSSVSKTRFSSSKSNSARELMATTSSAVEDGAGTTRVYEFPIARDLMAPPCGDSPTLWGTEHRTLDGPSGCGHGRDRRRVDDVAMARERGIRTGKPQANDGRISGWTLPLGRKCGAKCDAFVGPAWIVLESAALHFVPSKEVRVRTDTGHTEEAAHSNRRVRSRCIAWPGTERFSGADPIGTETAGVQERRFCLIRRDEVLPARRVMEFDDVDRVVDIRRRSDAGDLQDRQRRELRRVHDQMRITRACLLRLEIELEMAACARIDTDADAAIAAVAVGLSAVVIRCGAIQHQRRRNQCRGPGVAEDELDRAGGVADRSWRKG